MNYVFGALVDASGRAELYGTTDQSIDPDRLVCTSRISILEASTPNLLIVQNPLVSMLRAPMPCLEHWWMPRDELSFMALQIEQSIPIDWSVWAGLAFSRCPPPICWLCKIPSCHCWEHQCLVWSIGGCLGASWASWHCRPIDWSVRARLAFSRRPPLICWLCKIPSCQCWEHQCLVWSIGGCLGASWALWHYRPIDRSQSIGLYEPD